MSKDFNINNVAAVENPGQADILGDLAWYTISECEINRSELEQKLQSKSFEEHLPRQISPSDAFRRATSYVQRTNVETNTPNILLNYLVREVYSDRKEIVRHIVIEEIDKQGKKLGYEPDVAVIKYDKKSDTVDYQAQTDEAKSLVYESMQLFEKFKETYNARHIREMISNILSTMSPVPVRPSGGVYFVPKAHKSKLQRLVELINELGGSEAFKVPLMDTVENKDMVRRKIRDYILDTIKSASDFLKNEKVDKCNANIKLNEIKKIINDFKDYEKTLSVSMEEMGENLELLRMQARSILDRVS